MFIKIGNKLNVFTLCVWVGLCVITGWTLGPAVCHNSMTLPPPPPPPLTAQVRPRQDEFLQFSALFLLWWRLVLVKDCLARRDAQSCPVNPRPLHHHELGVNFLEARKEPRSKARSQHLPNKFGLAKGERTSRLFMMVIGFMLPSFCNSDQSDGNTPYFPLFRLLLWECSKDSLCNKYWEVIHSWVMLSGIYKKNCSSPLKCNRK